MNECHTRKTSIGRPYHQQDPPHGIKKLTRDIVSTKTIITILSCQIDQKSIMSERYVVGQA